MHAQLGGLVHQIGHDEQYNLVAMVKHFVSQKKSSFLQRLSELCFKILRACTYRNSPLPVCHWHFKHHWICWTIRHKWKSSLRNSLDLLQSLLLLSAVLNTSSFSYHSPVNGQSSTSLGGIYCLQNPNRPTRHCASFFGCGRSQMQQFILHLRGDIST